MQEDEAVALEGKTTGDGVNGADGADSALHTRTAGARSIPNLWELVYVLAFIHKFTDFERTIDGYDGPLEMEHALQQEGRSDLLDDVLCRFLTRVLNRRKTIERDKYFPILLEVFKTRKTDPVEWDEVRTNAGEDVFVGCENFYDLTPHDRVQCLRLLVDWQLLESEEIRSTIELHYSRDTKREDKTNELTVRSFGMGKKHRYYHIDESARIYKELASYSNNKWSPASSTLEEMKDLGARLVASEDKKEAKTGKKLVEEILPKVEEAVARKAKLAARRQRQAIELANAMSFSRETRTRARQRVNYAEVENGTDLERYFKDQDQGEESGGGAALERTYSAGGVSADGSTRSRQRNGSMEEEKELERRRAQEEGSLSDEPSYEPYRLPLKKRRIIATYPRSESESEDGPTGPGEPVPQANDPATSERDDTSQSDAQVSEYTESEGGEEASSEEAMSEFNDG